MILKLNNEQKNYIFENYGSSIRTITRISNILNELDLPFFDEEDYIYTVCDIVSRIETTKINKEIKNIGFYVCESGYTLSSAMSLVLNQKFNDIYLYKIDTIKKVSGLKK